MSLSPQSTADVHEIMVSKLPSYETPALGDGWETPGTVRNTFSSFSAAHEWLISCDGVSHLGLKVVLCRCLKVLELPTKIACEKFTSKQGRPTTRRVYGSLACGSQQAQRNQHACPRSGSLEGIWMSTSDHPDATSSQEQEAREEDASLEEAAPEAQEEAAAEVAAAGDGARSVSPPAQGTARIGQQRKEQCALADLSDLRLRALL